MLNLRILAALSLTGAAAAATTFTVLPVFSPFAGPAQEGEGAMEMMAMPKPGEIHEMIQMGVGEWEGKITMTMPGMGEMSYDCNETVEAIGGFHTRGLFQSDFMGMEFVGASTMSYDPEADEMIGTWMDGMTPTPALMRGKADLENQSLEMKWKAPTMGAEGLVPHRMVTKFSGDSYTSMMYVGEGDEAAHTMTIEMKKKQ